MLFFFLLMVMAGCSKISGVFSSMFSEEEHALLQSAYQAADVLHRQLSGTDVADYPMLAASFVNSENLERTSNVGRLLSEQVASRLSQLGYSIREIQLRERELAVRPQEGVFALSRESSKIISDMEALTILVGTYTIVERQIYVNARVLRTSDGTALASADFSLPYIRQQQTFPANSQSNGQLNGQSATVKPSVGTRLQ